MSNRVFICGLCGEQHPWHYNWYLVYHDLLIVDQNGNLKKSPIYVCSNCIEKAREMVRKERNKDDETC